MKTEPIEWEYHLQTLQNKILQFQMTKDPKWFGVVLEFTDDLIIDTVKKQQRSKRYLKGVPYPDLYQTAVMGVGRALTKIKMEMPIQKLPAKLKSYMTAALRDTYYQEGTEIPISQLMPEDSNGDGESDFSSDHFISLCIKDYDSHREKAENKLDTLLFFSTHYQRWVDTGVIKDRADYLLRQRFIYDRTDQEVAKELKCSRQAVTRRINKTIYKLKALYRREQLLSSLK